MTPGVSLLARFDALDKLLVVHGFPPTSPWWRRELERFLRSGRRRWVLRVGRRGGKSSTLCRLCVVVALWGEWSVPPGDTAVIPIVSVKREEAADRLTTVRAILSAIGVRHSVRGTDIEIPERRACISVTTCSLAGTVGFTSVMLFADEMAAWSNAETGANPAAEVMASLRPTMATQPTAFEVDSSAPWGFDDHHAQLFAAGEDNSSLENGGKVAGAGQIVSFAETWVANPTITEAETHDLEPDPRAWARAYAAQPSESVQADWFSLALDRAMAEPRCTELVLPWVRYTVAIDPAFSRDHFGWAVLSSRTLPSEAERPRRMTRIHAAGAWKVDRSPLEMAIRVREELCIPWHVASDGLNPGVFTDQFEGFSFTELARQAGVVLHVVPWTGGTGETSQLARYKSVRLAMLEGCLQLPPVLAAADGPRPDGLASELRRVSSVLLPSGGERIVLPRSKDGGHMDSVSAMVLGVSVALERAPQAEYIPLPGASEIDALRLDAVRKIEQKRRAEWKDQRGNMRDRMRRIS